MVRIVDRAHFYRASCIGADSITASVYYASALSNVLDAITELLLVLLQATSLLYRQ